VAETRRGKGGGRPVRPRGGTQPRPGSITCGRSGERPATLRGNPADDDVGFVLLEELDDRALDSLVEFPLVVTDLERTAEHSDAALSDHDAVASPDLEGSAVRSGLVAACACNDGFDHPLNLGLVQANARARPIAWRSRAFKGRTSVRESGRGASFRWGRPSRPDTLSGRSVPFAVPTFLAACLLFVAEPMFAKWLLPTLGGNPATWSACLLSFQVLLLAGYAYADIGSRIFSLRNQARAHLGLVGLGVLAALPLSAPSPPALPSLPFALAVPLFLIRRIGLPYVVLASTTPLLARWAATGPPASTRTTPRGTRTPTLYAISNAGSLVGLLAYPFLIEPFLDVHSQIARWAVAFSGFALAIVPVCLGVRGAERKADLVPVVSEPATPRPQQLFWLGSAFVPSVMLLAATNHVTVDIAATPLLWVAPLALYLISFIVAFGGLRPGFRGPVLALWILGTIGCSLNAFAQGAAPLSRQLGATLVALFACGLLCHGELAFERPPAHALTRYYLIIAFGGALGGVFVTLVAPLVFSDFYELELGSAATFLLLLTASRRSGPDSWSRFSRSALLAGCGVCLPLLAGSTLVRMERETRGGRVVERRRSFLGPLRVVDVAEGRVLTHGRIQHGLELRDPAPRSTPTMYFGPGTALERVLRLHHEGRPRNIGVVGLGIGTIAAYGEPGDRLRFYELDPNVVELARRDFTFLRDARAHVEVVLGDGRLALTRELPNAFDVLILDAFSSDAVPMHLLTREAFRVYVGHLANDGILLVNVSNRHLAVDRAVAGSARAQGLTCWFIETPSNASAHVSHVEWGVAARDPALAALLHGLPIVRPSPPEVLFTDRRASILALVR
jgi:hypothetical protein